MPGAVLVVGEAIGVDEEGRSACPNVVQLPVAIGQSPFISDSDVLWVGASTSDVGGPLRQEEMYWYICCDLGHVELAAWVAVDASPHATIIRNLPTIWWKLFSRKVAHRLVDVVLLLIRCNFFTSSFVALAQVDVLRHSSLSDVGQSLLCRIQWIPCFLCCVLDGRGRLDVLRRCSKKNSSMPNLVDVGVGPMLSRFSHDDGGWSTPLELRG